MADQDIQYRVTADMQGAVRAFEALNAEFNQSYTTVGQLKDRMKDVREEIDKTGINAPQKIESLKNEYAQLDATVRKFTETQKMSNTVIDHSGKLAQRTRLLNNELAFTIQDGAYAFNDLRMGVLGMSNNLPRVAYQMKELAIQTGSWGTAIKTAALGLFSFNGVMSLAVGGLVAWSALSGRSKKGNNELGDSFEELKKAVEEYNAVLRQLNNEEIRRLPILEDMNTKVFAAKKVTDLYSEAIENLGGGEAIKQYVFTLFGLSQVIDKTAEAQRNLIKELGIDLFSKYEKQIILITNAATSYNEKGLKGFLTGQKVTTGAIEATIKSLQDARKELIFNSKAYNENEKAVERLQDVLRKNSEPKLKKHLDEILETIKKIEAIKPDNFLLYFSNPNSVKPPTINTSKPLGGTKPLGSSPLDDAISRIKVSESEIRELFPIETTLVDAFQGGITDAGRQAFQDIFGEANSLLEIFMQNIATSFISLGAQDVAGGLLNILTGGQAGAVSGILDFLGLSKANTQPMQVNVNLDGERLAVAMVKSGTSQRVNQLNSSLRRN